MTAVLLQQPVVFDHHHGRAHGLQILGGAQLELHPAVLPHLQAVVAGDRHPVHRHHPAGVGRGPAGDARHQGVGVRPAAASSFSVDAGTRAFSGRGAIGASVPSMSHKTAPCRGSAGQRRHQVGEFPVHYCNNTRRVEPSRDSDRGGLLAGLLAGIFGVGGGVVIVPALVAFAAYPPKTAMATSLGAILFVAVAAGLWPTAKPGNVNFAAAALIGVPAAAGAFGGAWLHQRLDSRRLVLGFAAFLVLVA